MVSPRLGGMCCSPTSQPLRLHGTNVSGYGKPTTPGKGFDLSRDSCTFAFRIQAVRRLSLLHIERLSTRWRGELGPFRKARTAAPSRSAGSEQLFVPLSSRHFAAKLTAWSWAIPQEGPCTRATLCASFRRKDTERGVQRQSPHER